MNKEKLEKTWKNNEIIANDKIVINIDFLRFNKLYSPMFDTTFDLMSDEECKKQLDYWYRYEMFGLTPYIETELIHSYKDVNEVKKIKKKNKEKYSEFIKEKKRWDLISQLSN